MISVLQIVDFNKQLLDHIKELENECTVICKKLESVFFRDFQELHVEIIMDVIRCVKGKKADQQNILDENYASYIEIGIEEEDEYFPNAYIPIWKCKREMFQLIGYLTKADSSAIESKIVSIIQEMLQEIKEEMGRTD